MHRQSLLFGKKMSSVFRLLNFEFAHSMVKVYTLYVHVLRALILKVNQETTVI